MPNSRFHLAALFISSAVALTGVVAMRGMGEPSPSGAPAEGALASVNLMTADGAAACSGQWRYSDVRIVDSAFTAPPPEGSPRDAVGPANITYDISPRAGEADFDDSAWPVIAADTLGQRRAGGKVCFNWYRIALTMPEKVDGIDIAGCKATLIVTVDDYAEVWVNGQLPRTLAGDNANLVQGFNKPNRVTLSEHVKPGDQVQVAIFGINGPISAAPTNYIWFREARIEFTRP